MRGHLHSIQVSEGGVPKRSVESVAVDVDGLVGDRQAHPAFHGGPTRAVSLLGLDAIERLRAEGHPISPGSTGENLTLAGLSWADAVPGALVDFDGGVQLEVLSYAAPCRAIRASFEAARFSRMDARRHPAEARLYARVLRPGTLQQGEGLELTPCPGPTDPS